MTVSETRLVESEVGPGPMGAHLRAPDPVSEIQRRVDRGREIVARQRELAAKCGKRIPDAITLLQSFETTLALLEKTQAALKHSAALRAEAAKAVHGDRTVPAVTIDSHLEPDEPIRSKPAYEEQASVVARIMEILREGGYHCELDRVTLH